MKKSILPLIVMALTALFAGATMVYAAQADKKIVSMKLHEKEGLQCEDCHGEKNPTKADQAKIYASCLNCHANSDGTYRGELDDKGNGIEKEYSESRKTKMAAMHDSHVGKLRCTLCHTSHKAPDNKNIYCNYCHQFDVKIK